MTEALSQQVRQIVSDVFGVPMDHVREDSSPETVETWDSMRHLNLVLAVEEKFNLQFTPEEMEQMRSVGQIVELVHTRM